MRNALLLVCLTSASFSADWPRFRGPNGSGIAEAHDTPVEFNSGKNVIWKAKIPKGNSSPIIAGDRVYLTGFEKDDRIVLALDAASGKEIWRRTLPKSRAELAHPLNGPATPTPASDGSNIYIFFPEIGLLSFDAAGRERWRVPLGPFQSLQGLAGSPIVADNVVVLPIDQTKDSWVAAYDKDTGKQRWRVDRPSNLNGGYTTPILYQPKEGPKQVIMVGSVEITGYQIQTGERIWWASGLTAGPAATPTLNGDLLFAHETAGSEDITPFSAFAAWDKNKDGKLDRSEIKEGGWMVMMMGIDKQYGNGDGFIEASEWDRFIAATKEMGGMIALQLTGRGDLTKAGLRWRLVKSVPYLTASLIYDNILYSVRDGGILSTINPETGEVLKQARLEGAIDKYYASPVAAGGKIYFTSEQGKIAVIQAGPQWRMLAVNDLEEPAYATPALSDGRIYVRTSMGIYCFGTIKL